MYVNAFENISMFRYVKLNRNGTRTSPLHSCQPSRFLRDSPEFNSMSRLPDPASFCPGLKECPIKMNDSMFCSYFCSCNQKQRSVKPFDSQRFECGMIIGYLCMVINQQVPSWSGLKPINRSETSAHSRWITSFQGTHLLRGVSNSLKSRGIT